MTQLQLMAIDDSDVNYARNYFQMEAKLAAPLILKTLKCFYL